MHWWSPWNPGGEQSDLLSRLREQSEWFNDGHGPLHKEAAAEIERLLTENESLKLTLIELNANKDLRLAGTDDTQQKTKDAEGNQ